MLGARALTATYRAATALACGISGVAGRLGAGFAIGTIARPGATAAITAAAGIATAAATLGVG
jgi:hypothetical protein